MKNFRSQISYFVSQIEFPPRFKLMMLAVWFLVGGMVFGQGERGRTWTSSDGQRIYATLLRLEDEGVVLDWRGKETKVALAKLGDVDLKYVDEFRGRIPFGKVEGMEIEPESVQEEFLTAHGVRSFVWKGRIYGRDEVLPFLMAEPAVERRAGEKIPLVIYLSGTGGIGGDNLKALFKDADGIAKELLGERFQKNHPCHVMVPQPSEIGTWSDISWTLPGAGLKGVVDAVRILLAGEEYEIDPGRIYIVGLSMGGRGAVQGAAKFPGFFAAGVVISSLDHEGYFSKERDNVTPLWVAINRGDQNLEERLEVFSKHYRKLGGELRSTVYEKGGHDAWNRLMADQEFKQWLFRQKVE